MSRVIAVIGSRTFDDYVLMDQVLRKAFKSGDRLVSGGAIGADAMADLWCKQNGYPTRPIQADWNAHGSVAGFERNPRVIQAAHVVIAFWDMKSSGTMDALMLAQVLGKPVQIVPFEV